MLDVYIPSERKPDVKPSRGWMIAAIAFALIGVIAGGIFVQARFHPSATSANYAADRAFYDDVRTAVALTAMFAPVIAICLGILGRAWIGSLAGALALAIIAIGLPGMLRPCCGGDESSMIGILRAINSSQHAYEASCANGKYAAAFDALLKPPLAGGTAFIGVDLRSGYWRGYRLTMQIPDAAPMKQPACNGVTMGASTYFVEAHHTDPTLGHRNFATDERGTIYQRTDGRVIQPGMAGAQPIQ